MLVLLCVSIRLLLYSEDFCFPSMFFLNQALGRGYNCWSIYPATPSPGLILTLQTNKKQALLDLFLSESLQERAFAYPDGRMPLTPVFTGVKFWFLYNKLDFSFCLLVLG